MLVGHWTLNDCPVAGSAATQTSANVDRMAPAPLLDIRPPLPLATAFLLLLGVCRSAVNTLLAILFAMHLVDIAFKQAIFLALASPEAK